MPFTPKPCHGASSALSSARCATLPRVSAQPKPSSSGSARASAFSTDARGSP
ncbi:hypothetical protein PF005_g19895 [Phytophthora fragariae]|uniref:Uncharacterized protein n=1 Tax=Phytophthora fragariae TaxID=53985 RepID=A0A6A4C9H3_9STRA|nr:hypothetical protein PF003_g31991 [Phytophthora fragariae]KAE8916407.1 hypothetical protein PF009_g33270 [Phytophthora fragariae]KAE8989994.1 hypothetical protein PF011_g18542 [Phytophthora fragariae]KAE9080906.1 hypothetical protein PF010_g22211 [Phytophthora fragariae]KAE9088121.1 hypothetical protein PF007_g20100 [Phytophthora fragariae]